MPTRGGIVGIAEKLAGNNNQIQYSTEFQPGLRCQQVTKDIQNDVNMVTNFVEAVRIQQHPEDKRKSDVSAVGLAQAQDKAEKTIIEAEKFRAHLEPPGMIIDDQLQEHFATQQQDLSQSLDFVNERNDQPVIRGGEFLSRTPIPSWT